MTIPQYSGQNNSSSGASSPWGLQPQYIENFYNNPIQYPVTTSSNNLHCYQVNAINYHPHLPNGNGTTCYQPHQQTTKSCHSHYPAIHPHSVEYQAYNQQNGDRKCSNGRMCNSCDALISPQQPLLPNQTDWPNQTKTNGTAHTHTCNKQNSQQQLYQCSSEYSDHSLKSHSQHSHSSQDRSTKSGTKECCRQRSMPNRQCAQSNCNGKTVNGGHFTTIATANGANELNGNADNIYENDDETTEHDRMITSASDCCSSVGELDGDSCCSCTLYAEAGDPSTQTTTVVSSQQSSSQNESIESPTPAQN